MPGSGNHRLPSCLLEQPMVNKLGLHVARQGDEMQGRTIAVKVTGGDMIKLYITDEDAQCVIVDVAPLLDIETRLVLECGLMGGVPGESSGNVLRAMRCNRVHVQMPRGARRPRRDVNLGLAGQLAEVTA